MSISQIIIVSVLLSLPLIGLIATGRAVLCAWRCQKIRKTAYVILSCLYVVIMIGVLIFAVVVLFGYGVAHSGKNASTDLIVLSITVVPTYVAACAIWFLSRHMEKRL